PPAEQMLPVDAALARPRAARWLKLLSLSPPVSVTRPTLIFGDGVEPPAEVVPPHAAMNISPAAIRPRNRSCGRNIFRAPFKELSRLRVGRSPSSISGPVGI